MIYPYTGRAYGIKSKYLAKIAKGLVVRNESYFISASVVILGWRGVMRKTIPRSRTSIKYHNRLSYSKKQFTRCLM